MFLSCVFVNPLPLSSMVFMSSYTDVASQFHTSFKLTESAQHCKYVNGCRDTIKIPNIRIIPIEGEIPVKVTEIFSIKSRKHLFFYFYYKSL